MLGHVEHDDLLACYAAAQRLRLDERARGFRRPARRGDAAATCRCSPTAPPPSATRWATPGCSSRRNASPRWPSWLTLGHDPALRAAVLAGQDRRLAAFEPAAVEATLRSRWSPREREAGAARGRVRRPALRRGHHRGLGVARARGGGAPGRGAPHHRVHHLRARLRDLAQRAARGPRAAGRRRRAALPGRGGARSRRLQRVRGAALRAGAHPRRGDRVPAAAGAARAAARRGAPGAEGPLRGGRLLHLPLLADLLGPRGGPRARRARAHDPRRAAAAVRHLPGGLRPAARFRLPDPGRGGPRAPALRRRRRPCVLAGMGVDVPGGPTSRASARGTT